MHGARSSSIAVRAILTSCRVSATASTVGQRRYAGDGGDRSWSHTVPQSHNDDMASRGIYTSPSSTSAENYAAPPRPKAPLSPEAARWWPDSQDPAQLRSLQGSSNIRQREKPWKEGLNVVPMEETPSPTESLAYLQEDAYDIKHRLMAMDTAFDHEKRLPPPSTFDPAIDDVDDSMHVDGQLAAELNASIDHDRKRLAAFSNPVTLEAEVEVLLQPQRQDEKNLAHRADFNGFSHWGLLHAAMIALEEQKDFKRAHQLVNQYMRDQDLFVAWLKHPKVVAHIEKKFGLDISQSYDKLMGLAMSFYIRGKIQAFEGDLGTSLKSLSACTTMINESGDLETNVRHRKMLGAALAARGAIFSKLKSFERANDDFTKALLYVPSQRSASLFQMRAEAREQLGLIEEARRDEEQAAEIWETADVITPGMDGEPQKFVI